MPSPPTAPTALQLYRIGKGWLPRTLFQRDDEQAGKVREALWLAAKVWARVGQRVDELFRNTLIGLSSGIYLDQHMKDRGQPPQGPLEGIPTARQRARTIADAATTQVIRGIADQLLQGAGLPACNLIELRRDKAWLNIGPDLKRTAYCSRGDRMGPNRHPSFVIVVLPFGTTDALALAISAAILKRRSAGYPHLIEVRRIAP